MSLRPADSIHAVQSGQYELDAACTYRFASTRVDFECHVPCWRDRLETLGVLAAGQEVTDFDADSATKDLGDLREPCLLYTSDAADD